MTARQINEAIAEACGWKILETPIDDCGFAAYAKDQNGCLCAGIPDYCKDLNAMHEAEETMIFSERKKFVRELQKVIGRQFAPEAMVWLDACIHATARQRAEAFLRTIGKWEEAVK